MSLRQVFRYAGALLGIVGAALAVFSIVEVDLAHATSRIIMWMVPETVGLLLIVFGLHAWIDWKED